MLRFWHSRTTHHVTCAEHDAAPPQVWEKEKGVGTGGVRRILCKAPDISAEQQEQALNSGAIPTVTSTDVEKELIWKKIKEAQIAGNDILARILLRAYGDLDSSSRPVLAKTCLADPVLLTVDQASIASAIAKGKTQMEDGIIYAVGTVSSHQDVGFVPFFDENIKELKAPLPLTSFNREWQKEALEYHIQFKGSKSTDKTYKGLPWLSEWTQTRSKWTQNHWAFHLTLRDVYNKVIFTAKLLKHKENCDAISDQYGFMTAFRYDIQVRHNTFLRQVHTTSGAAIQDIEIRQDSIVEVCYTTVRTNLETRWLDNCYTAGGSHSMINPDTGRPHQLVRSQSHDVRTGRDGMALHGSHLANYGSGQHYQPGHFGGSFIPGPMNMHLDYPYQPNNNTGNYEQTYHNAGYVYAGGAPSFPRNRNNYHFPGPPQGPRKRARGYQGTNFKDGYVNRRAPKKDEGKAGGSSMGGKKKIFSSCLCHVVYTMLGIFV
ncbi:hypothetical protein MJO28_010362 [Puccinia striiformis f. sp. tritici]|uniref:Uncharacterized protein n=1 Tax=Puccinia striiformis f. sp. tritici TaxID=168172 RepID=A0ACC0E4X2_9BASI|nr:hypothetical protein MJO28_010362 [Puccinia striiformis f. sp. tritici]